MKHFKLVLFQVESDVEEEAGGISIKKVNTNKAIRKRVKVESESESGESGSESGSGESDNDEDESTEKSNKKVGNI